MNSVLLVLIFVNSLRRNLINYYLIEWRDKQMMSILYWYYVGNIYSLM